MINVTFVVLNRDFKAFLVLKCTHNVTYNMFNAYICIFIFVQALDQQLLLTFQIYKHYSWNLAVQEGERRKKGKANKHFEKSLGFKF